MTSMRMFHDMEPSKGAAAADIAALAWIAAMLLALLA